MLDNLIKIATTLFLIGGFLILGSLAYELVSEAPRPLNDVWGIKFGFVLWFMSSVSITYPALKQIWGTHE